MATKKKPAVKPAKAKASTPAKKAAPKAAKKAATPVKKKAVAAKPIAKKTVASKAAPAKKASKVAAKPAVKAKTPPKPAKKAAPVAKATNTKKTPVKATPAKKTAPAKKVASDIKKPAIALKKTETKKTTMVKKTETTNKSTAKKETVKPAAAPAKKETVVKKAAPAPAKKAAVPASKSATALRSAPAARPEPTPAPAPSPRGEKKPTVIVAHRRLENKSKQVEAEPSGKTMINYQPDFTRSILDEPEMQSGPVYRYSDEELNEFRELIQGRLEAARKELGFLQGLITRKDEAGTEDTENRYMNMEDGSGAMEREQLAQLASRQIQFINHLEKALIRIENKTYGICRVTGKLIDKARLRAVPHATLSIEAKKTMTAR